MKFCPECGNNIEGAKFCPECGYKVGGSTTSAAATVEPVKEHGEKELLTFSTYMFGMENQKANIGGKFDISMPKENYTITSERLIIEKQGVVSKKREEIELFTIKDINVKQGLKEKVLKIGDVEIISKDSSTPVLVLRRVQDPAHVREVLRAAVRDLKKSMNVSYREEL
ncbi:Hypothetical protein Tpal_462 [Trichococcus palustris]|uniref:Uncharacterized protein n=1 Tax=Trichococcus palustris TaxID=140314 RepID=A0A143Y9Z4_9LACT|nr:PH domain-containing protein [Trichococcus palustris]CZQ83573.1 Hypothetical protein Tpal_462 [Trichococcus palustris]SFK70126.1 zinc-ribbon domain-containing protein [Trichococcus palustris]